MQSEDGDREQQPERAPDAAPTTPPPRLLPWTTDDGKRCLLSSDDGDGYLSRLADKYEAAQLALGSDVLTLVRPVLEDLDSQLIEVRYSAVRLAECLADALRIAESRGLRLGSPQALDYSDEDTDDPMQDDGDDSTEAPEVPE
ncbi:hypothetical protein [Streptomyces acidiscabies]|uniref:hypothetical protein n=1 Tax=Streptomyces acidiscabies TaxID=42234 RepID=UPI0038F68B24